MAVAQMEVYVDFKVNKKDCAVLLRGQDVKFWDGFGLPTFEGALDVLCAMCPDVEAALLRLKLIKAAS